MEEVYDFLKNKINLKPNDVIIAGISGGPDSMALLYVLNEIKKEIDIKIICAHINHNKRIESEEEQVNLEKYCKDKKIIFECKKIEKWGDDNFENEARTVRYNFFEELVENYDAKYLMTAHHADDLMETIMMRIVRGSTLKGYSGFSRIIQKDGYKIVRPLLSMTKLEIEEYCKKNSISYAVDKSNFDLKYTRNRYRHQVLPFLKNENPNVHKKFIKYSETLLEASEYISKEVNEQINKVFQNGVLDISKFKSLEHLIQTNILYSILEKIYGDDLLIIGDAHVELLFNLIMSEKSNSLIHLPNNVIAIKAYNELQFQYNEDEYDEYEIEIGDIVNLPNGKIIEAIDDINDNSNNIIRLNSADLKLPLYVRNRKDGDKMQVKGLNGTKKIKEIFIENKIKKSDRDLWPVVLDAEENIVWLPGLKKSKLDKKIGEEYNIILRYY